MASAPSEDELIRKNSDDNLIVIQGNAIEGHSHCGSSDTTASNHFDIHEGQGHYCTCIRRLSMHLTSINDLENLCEGNENPCSNAADFLSKVSVATRSAVAKYLSSGKSSHLNLCRDNFHTIFHISKLLRLQQLCKVCLEYYADHESDLVSQFEKCSLKDQITQQLALYQRSMSVTPDTEDRSPPEFYVLFSTNATDTKKGKKDITHVVVLGMSERIYLYHRVTGQVGKATNCCSTDIDMSPFIFVCGGEGKHSNVMWKYDVLLGEWGKCARLIHGRSRHNMIADRYGSVYAIGGIEVACIEQYNTQTNKWNETSRLKTHTYDSVVAMYNQRIYILGGRTPSGYVGTVQCYDLESNTVTKQEELPCNFSGGRAIVSGNKVYIATPQRHMICFEPETGVSYLCAQQPIERDHFGMFLKGGKLYIVGGVLGSKNDDDTMTEAPMYRYNPESDRWKEEKNLCRSFPVYAACIVKYPRHCSVIPFRDRN